MTFGSDPSITLGDSYNGGSVIDGSRYVIAPAGVKAASSSPTAGVVDGRAGHGLMADIQLHENQGFDAAALVYDAAKVASAGAVFRPGSCLVKVKSTDPVGNPRDGCFAGVSVLHVVASAPAAGSMAPVVWPSDDLANKPWRVADVDGLLSSLPSLAASGLDSWATLSAFWDKLDFSRSMGGGARHETLAHKNIGGFAGGGANYGQERARVAGKVWAGICSDMWSAADKTAAIIRALSNGCQTVETYAAFSLVLGEDGGHNQHHLADCMAWLKATGRTGQYAAVMPKIGGNVLGQYYTVTAGMFAPHDSAVLPYIARRRTVSAITGSGPYVVTCTDYRPASGLAGDTASNGDFTGLNMIRESNGAVALITAESGSGVGTGWDFTVATLPTGLVVGNVIYCGEVTPLSVGTTDFILRNPVSYGNLPNPSPNAEYRSNNIHGNVLMPMSVLGMRGGDLASAKTYLERVSAGASYGGGPHQAFWATHQATILAMPQIV